MKRLITKLELVEKDEQGSEEKKLVLSRIGEEDLYRVQYISNGGELISYLKKEFNLKENILLTKKEVGGILGHFLKYIVEYQKGNSDTKKRFFLHIGVK